MSSSIFGNHLKMVVFETTPTDFSKNFISQQLDKKSAKADDDRFIFDWAI
jgi:hypothetical protein